MKEKAKPARRPEATTIRWTDEDWRIIEDLREDLRKQQGGRNTSEIVRMGLRALQRETKKKYPRRSPHPAPASSIGS